MKVSSNPNRFHSVYQDYYERTLLRDRSTSSIAWIGSLQYFLIFGVGIFTGRLFDAGLFYVLYDTFSVGERQRVEPTRGFMLYSLMLPCFAVIVIFQMLLSVCTEYYQLILCQGLGLGLCFGVLMNMTVGVPAHWFRTKRAIAMGVVCTLLSRPKKLNC